MFRIQSVLLIGAAVVLLAGCGVPGAAQGTADALAPAATATLATEPFPTQAVATAAATMAPTVASSAATAAPTVASPASAAGPVVTATAMQSSAPTAEATASGSSAATAPDTSAAAGVIRLMLQPDSQVGYRVREQLANLKAPNDAVGTTNAVTGTVVIQADGKILSDQSKFVADLDTLKSDSGMRDGFIKRNTLQTGTYPEAVFVPIAVEGLTAPLPSSGEIDFKLTGDLTVRGVTKQVTWDVQGKIAGNDLTGTARTAVKFGDFGMTPPTTMRVLSVEDNVVLEVAYHMTAAME